MADDKNIMDEVEDETVDDKKGDDDKGKDEKDERPDEWKNDPILKSYKTLGDVSKGMKHAQQKITELSSAPTEYPKEIVPEGLDVPKDILEAMAKAGIPAPHAKSALTALKDQLVKTGKREVEATIATVTANWGVSEARAKERLRETSKWAEGKFGKEETNRRMKTVQGINGLEDEMRQEARSGRAGSGSSGYSGGGKYGLPQSKAELRELRRSDERYDKDPQFAKELDAAIEAAA